MKITLIRPVIHQYEYPVASVETLLVNDKSKQGS